MTNSAPNERASVLVVDDNPLIVNVLKSLLLSAEYDVLACTNGKEAVDLLGANRVDVIICDVMMPNMDGYELHEVVRGRSELSFIPFIFLTALSDNFEVLRGKESGADDYLVKPFDPRELLSIVKGKVKRSMALRAASEERYDTYRKKVIHTLSHEFRTPLVAINTGTELLLDQQNQLEPHKAQNLLEAVRRGGQRLERLVNDFMVLQQIEGGVAKRLFDSRVAEHVLSKIISEFLEVRSESLAPQGFTVKVVDNSGGGRVRVYEPQIIDIIDRLLSNCVKFKNVDLLIEIVLLASANDVSIEVRDRGIGVDADRASEALDVFGQINREKLEQQGGGLGLAIANRYAVLNGGTLTLASRQGGGAVATLTIPLVK